MDARKDIRHVLFVAALAAAAGVFSANAFAMPAPTSIDAVGRSSDWILRHGLATTPKVDVGRDVNEVSGRASIQAMPAGKAAARGSATVEHRDIAIFGRA